MMFKSTKRFLALIMILALMMTLLLTSCGSSDSKKLNIGMEVGYPPMEMVGSDGSTVVGFDVDVGREIAKRLGKEDINIVSTAWDGIFTALVAKKYDCIISACSIKPERIKAYSLTKAYVANRQVLVVRSDETGIKTPQDLAGKKLGLQGGTTAEDYVTKELIAKGIKVSYTPYQKVTQAFSDLKIGRTNAVLVDVVVAGYYLVQDKKSFNMVWESPDAEPMAIAFRKGDSALRNKVNKILDEMQADGTMAKISKKWFSKDITKGLN